MIPSRYQDFYGDQMRWFTGLVVDINDPVQLARVKVRIYGVHSDNTLDIPDEDLPWAQVVAPVTTGGTEGIGNPLGLKVGALVFGIFMDGQNSQLPLIFGSMPKYEDLTDPGDRLDKSVNALARGTQTKTYNPDQAILEPDDPYAAVYPYNRVYETESGHVKEYDDTPDAERIRELHKSGTFYQVSPDGDLVTHIVRDRYTAISGNDSIHITGDVTVIINGNAEMQIDGNWNVDVDGDIAINGKTINLNNGTKGAARIDDTADVGDDPPGISGSDGSNKIQTGSGTVFIGD